MDDFEAELERENRIRELKAKKRKLSKFSWSLQKALKLDLVTKEKITTKFCFKMHKNGINNLC